MAWHGVQGAGEASGRQEPLVNVHTWLGESFLSILSSHEGLHFYSEPKMWVYEYLLIISYSDIGLLAVQLFLQLFDSICFVLSFPLPLD